MYEAYYGLQERPFDLTPNPRFLFMTAGHREALSTLQYGIAGSKGITLLVGPAGTGKTTLIRAALEQQSGSGGKALCLTNPTLTREEFFEFLALEFGLSARAASSKTHFLRELREMLVARRADGVITALIVDEAQAMPDQLLEEVRLLANVETSTEKLLPVVLVGQLELSERLRDPRLQQLRQRVALRCSLPPLTRQETGAYIAERIRIASGDARTVFSPDAVAAIYEASRGIPRMISVICDNALVCGFALDQRPVGQAVIAEVRRDFDLQGAGEAVGRETSGRTRESAGALARPAEPVYHGRSILALSPVSVGSPSAAAVPPAARERQDAGPAAEGRRWGIRGVLGRMVSR